MLPEVDHPVSAVNRLQPVVGGQVVVGGWQVRAVVAESRIPLIAAAGLNQNHHRTKTAAMDGKAPGLQMVVLGGWSPALQHRLACRGRQLGKPGFIDVQGQVGHGRQGQAAGIVAAPHDELVDQLIPIGGQLPSHAIARRRQPTQTGRHTGRGVQPHAVGQMAVAGWIVGQNNGQTPLVRWCGGQVQPGPCPLSAPGQPLRHRGVAQQRAVQLGVALLHLLEAHHPPQEPSIQFRQHHLHPQIPGSQAHTALLPSSPGAAAADHLEYGAVQLIPEGGGILCRPCRRKSRGGEYQLHPLPAPKGHNAGLNPGCTQTTDQQCLGG